MKLIDALLTLPQRGTPVVASRELATVLAAGSARFVRRHAALWSLTDDGQRFLTQFHPYRSDVISKVEVRLVTEDDGPVFHLVCDAESVLRVPKNDLRRCLHEIQQKHPHVKIMFDFRRPGRES